MRRSGYASEHSFEIGRQRTKIGSQPYILN